MQQLSELACVFIGGGLGSVCRYALGFLLPRLTMQHFPWATLAANLTGCLVIGALIALFERKGAGVASLLLVTGFCGGFTTFSTFSNDTVQMLRNGLYAMAATYTLASLAGGLTLCLAGYAALSQRDI